MNEQYTLPWWRERLGLFTASSVGKLMGAKEWTQTALSYMYDTVLTERMLSRDIVDDDEEFGFWLENHRNTDSRATSWGHAYEDEAREYYAQEFKNRSIVQCGSIVHPTLPFLSASPDGIVDGKRLLEIKCPFTKGVQYMARLFNNEFGGNEDLKTVNPDYYWQVQCSLACAEAEVEEFVVYVPTIGTPKMLVTPIWRNDKDIALLEERVTHANDFINNMIDVLTNTKF